MVEREIRIPVALNEAEVQLCRIVLSSFIEEAHKYADQETYRKYIEVLSPLRDKLVMIEAVVQADRKSRDE